MGQFDEYGRALRKQVTTDIGAKFEGLPAILMILAVGPTSMEKMVEDITSAEQQLADGQRNNG